MSAKTIDVVVPDESITLDEIKAKAVDVKELALSEVKRVSSEAYEQDITKVALVAVGVVIVVASLAYFLGSRSGRRAYASDM